MSEVQRTRVLLISDGDSTLEKSIAADAFKSADLHITDVKSAYESLQKHNYDFVIAPPSLIALFRTEGEQLDTEEDIETYHTEKISELFSARSGELLEYLMSMKNDIYTRVLDAAEAEGLICKIYSTVISNAFSGNEWLELYLSHEDFEGQGSAYLKERLMALYSEYTALFPAVHSDKTEEVILYILNNPESDLRQKTIASKMYVNSSYLSTVFAAQTGERFVDYLTSVKLKRAAYLLMKSTMKVSEIASRLDYKDIGYFSRLFKNHYGIPPSEYRIPDNYTYEI